jgi:predicted AAA+ superfamily ATPase
MEKLIEYHHQILKDIPTSFVRSFADKIHWEERLIGIKGAKGTGKSTLILQYIKKQPKDRKTIYLSLDHPYFFGNTVSDTIEDFFKIGYTDFFLDEVHKYPSWSSEVKSLYDTYRKIKIVFTGSSILSLIKGTADLSRRAMMYSLPGLSFREYIELAKGITLQTYPLNEILQNHIGISDEITESLKPFELFSDYLQHGYYPYFIEAPKTYRYRVNAAINQTLESDLPLIKNISPEVVVKLKRILGVIAQSAPFKPNIQRISEKVGVSRNSLVTYLRHLEESAIIKQLYTSVQGIGSLQKPQKIYFENPNLIYALSELSSQIGTVRETFVLNQLGHLHQIAYPKSGDFLVDGKYTFEVGGRHKSKKQVSDIEDSFILADNLEIGYENKIPLWLLGFLY